VGGGLHGNISTFSRHFLFFFFLFGFWCFVGLFRGESVLHDGELIESVLGGCVPWCDVAVVGCLVSGMPSGFQDEC
jgi:hypothetical protein